MKYKGIVLGAALILAAVRFWQPVIAQFYVMLAEHHLTDIYRDREKMPDGQKIEKFKKACEAYEKALQRDASLQLESYENVCAKAKRWDRFLDVPEPVIKKYYLKGRVRGAGTYSPFYLFSIKCFVGGLFAILLIFLWKILHALFHD